MTLMRLHIVYLRVCKYASLPNDDRAGCHQSHPSLRDGFVLCLFPGNKLPGYVHLVPTGQKRALIYIWSLHARVCLPSPCLYRTIGCMFFVEPASRPWPGSGCCFSSDPHSFCCIYRLSRGSVRRQEQNSGSLMKPNSVMSVSTATALGITTVSP
jgi:hypothetical protein